jgi:hypothetical protein
LKGLAQLLVRSLELKLELLLLLLDLLVYAVLKVGVSGQEEDIRAREYN